MDKRDFEWSLVDAMRINAAGCDEPNTIVVPANLERGTALFARYNSTLHKDDNFHLLSAEQPRLFRVLVPDVFGRGIKSLAESDEGFAHIADLKLNEVGRDTCRGAISDIERLEATLSSLIGETKEGWPINWFFQHLSQELADMRQSLTVSLAALNERLGDVEGK